MIPRIVVGQKRSMDSLWIGSARNAASLLSTEELGHCSAVVSTGQVVRRQTYRIVGDEHPQQAQEALFPFAQISHRRPCNANQTDQKGPVPDDDSGAYEEHARSMRGACEEGRGDGRTR